MVKKNSSLKKSRISTRKEVTQTKKNHVCLRKKALIFFIATLVFFGLDMLIGNKGWSYLLNIVYLIGSIISFVYAVKLVKKKDYGYGIPILVISGLFLLVVYLLIHMQIAANVANSIMQQHMATFHAPTY